LHKPGINHRYHVNHVAVEAKRRRERAGGPPASVP
jgi:hypothetical protein